MFEKDRNKAVGDLSMRYANIKLIRNKVKEIIRSNEEELDRLTVWRGMGDEYSLTGIYNIT
jgi:hypothetical protein